MKRTSTLLTVLLTTLSYVGLAQNQTAKIIGKVGDGDHRAMAAVSLSLLKAKDSSIVKIAISDKEGKFVFENLPEGKYLVLASAVGHKAMYSDRFELNSANSPYQLQPMSLPVQSKDLKAVVVSGHKPLVEQHIDKMVVNVDAAVSNVGATALEVLEKSPGITVDKDGNISLKGKQGVQVFIDGKPSYLSGQELLNLLTNMNANQLDQIEIMTNPPAKYDAAGNSGVINIKTKKNKAKGFNGSATAAYSQGAYWSATTSSSRSR